MVATSTLIRNTPKTVKRFGLISSIGVERYGSLPFNILNLGGESGNYKLRSLVEIEEKDSHPPGLKVALTVCS